MIRQSYFAILSLLAAPSAAASGNLRGGGTDDGRRLFAFDGPCTPSDYASGVLYVSPSGNNWSSDNGWGLSESRPFRTIQHAVNSRGPCQTVYVMEGTYQNNYYGRSKNHANKVVSLNGVSDLKLLAHPDSVTRPVLQFDGPGGIFGGSASVPLANIEIAGLEVVGPSADITYDEAMADRLVKRTYYAGRGIAIWAGHHIYIHDMVVHHCPASGIRVNKGDYVTVENSTVYSNTWWSSSAESAIVLAEGVSVDTSTGIKMRLVGNTVYDNVNKIPYYNPSYGWDYTPIGDEDCSSYPACESGLVEGCPWQCRYGKATQDYIIDGMGVYVTRNADTYLHGRTELADNTAYGNGINGVVFHRTDRGVVRRNTVYGNGVVPRLDRPEEGGGEDWTVPLSRGRQPYSGIVINNAEGVSLWSNKVAARYDDDYAYTTEADGGGVVALSAGGNNRVCRGLVDGSLGGYVVESSDPSACGIVEGEEETASPSPKPTEPPTFAPTGEPSPAPTEPPSPKPTASPTPAPTGRYAEISCGDRCHLIQWPYVMGNSYPPSSAVEECGADCDAGDCRAYSLQDDYRPGMGGKSFCFLYRESKQPRPAVCRDDPFNRPRCTYATSNGRFFVTAAAKAEYNVKDLNVFA